MLGAVALLAVALFVLWNLWSQNAELEKRLAATERQANELEQSLEASREQVSDLRTQSQQAQTQATEATEAAELQAAKRQQAELEREFARERAERSQLESERARAEAARARAELDRVRKAREQELDRMHQALEQIVETRRTPQGMVMSLGEDQFLFDFDKASLGPRNRELLSRIAGVLLVSHGYHLFVYGHTDDVGTQEYNQQLSERRALAVRGYLVEAGVSADIVEAKGFGKSSPRAKGTSRSARRKNRRVEIGVVDTIINYEREVRGEPGNPEPQGF